MFRFPSFFFGRKGAGVFFGCFFGRGFGVLGVFVFFWSFFLCVFFWEGGRAERREEGLGRFGEFWWFFFEKKVIFLFFFLVFRVFRFSGF